MRTVRLHKTLKFIHVLLYVALVPLAFFALFSYTYYRFLVIQIGIFVVLWLISRLRQSRHSALKYRWGAFIGVTILWVVFIVSPEFNFLMTFPVRQRTVTHFIETYKPPQSDVPLKTVLLGKATGNIGPDSDNVAVYFRYYGVGSRVSDRAFIIFTTRPIAQVENTLYADPGTAKQLKTNWFFIQTPPKGFD